METAKVDIKKLQILSDRINQCIDALNQVRISVHGLSQANPFAQGGIGALAGSGFGQVPGLSHTSPFGIGVNAAGLGQTGFGQPGLPGAFGQVGFASMGPGLSHTSPEGLEAYPYSGATWSDPYLAARVTQTFPYLKFAVPPVVSLY